MARTSPIAADLAWEIRKKWLEGKSRTDLAIEYQLPLCTIRYICRRKEATVTGEQVSTAKLNEAKVRIIRLMILQGYLLKEIASFFGVSLSAVGDISSRRTWANVD